MSGFLVRDPLGRASFALAMCLLAGCGVARAPLVRDADLIEYFHIHHANLDSLAMLDRDQIAWSWTHADTDMRWNEAHLERRSELLRRVDLRGGEWLLDSTQLCFPRSARRLSVGRVDVKGLAWLRSLHGFDTTAADLDTVDVQRLIRSRIYHVRHIEGDWWAYRAVTSTGSID